MELITNNIMGFLDRFCQVWCNIIRIKEKTYHFDIYQMSKFSIITIEKRINID